MFVRSTARAAEVVHETRFPLIALERYRARLEPAVLASARRELLGEDSPVVATGRAFRSGFLLGVQADPATHPCCLELAHRMHTHMLADVERNEALEFSLSFYKLGEGTPPAVDDGPLYEGPHLDTHPQLTDSVELSRLLVNLSRHPRRLLYCSTDRWLLADRGVRYGRRDFERLRLPPGTETRVVVVPGRTDTTIHALKFVASAVPHVGLNDPPEHFLLSFEALTEVDSWERSSNSGSTRSIGRRR